MSKIQNDLAKLMDGAFGKDDTKRVYKLLEEVEELREASLQLTQLTEKRVKAATNPEVQLSTFNEIEAHYLDELVDVTAVVAHLQHLSGYTTNELLYKAYQKISRRLKDPNYNREHEHIKTKGDI